MLAIITKAFTIVKGERHLLCDPGYELRRDGARQSSAQKIRVVGWDGEK